MLRSRYKANSRYVSIEAYPFALPCGERIEGERIDACLRAVSACWYSLNFRPEKIDFCLVSCTPLEGPPKPSLRWARCLTTGSVYFVFHCNNQLLLHFSIIGAGNNGLTSRPNESFVGGSSCVVRSFDGEFGSLRRYHRYSTQEGITRTSGETNFSGLHRDSCAARGQGTRPLGEPLSDRCSKYFVQAGPRAPAHEVFTRKIKIHFKIKLKAQGLPGRTNGVRLLLDKWVAIARRVCLCMV